jgi:signal transduction histidine kinase
LRSPLGAISMGANLLSRIAETQQIAKPVSHILRSADRMERMIFQLLDFTHVRLGRGLPLVRVPVDLLDVCRTVISELETATGGDIGLQSLGDANGSWDRDRLAQLVSNLAANACHHGIQGRPIQVVVDGTGEHAVHLEVVNAGVIPADLLPVIFEPLRFRDDGEGRREQRKSSGLGLGLYITQQIVLAHGGEIGVESDAASNTTRFTVLLPRDARRHSDRVFDSWSGPR